MGALPELGLRAWIAASAGCWSSLRADGLEDDTVIIFFADNGRLEAARHPLVLRQRPARADDHPLAEELSGAAADQARRA